MIAELPITLWLCGHEHHKPYSAKSMIKEAGVTCINVASVSHAYGTKTSGSLVLDFEENGREIVARRRDHDSKRFQREFEIKIPLDKRIHLAP